MKIAVEYIKWLNEERLKINSMSLQDLEFFENGMKLDIPLENTRNFECTGLNNIDFISTNAYKDETKTTKS